jgi:translation initiation factor 4G
VGKNGKTGGGSSNNLAAMGGGKQSSLSGPYVAAAHNAAMPTEKEKLKRDAQQRDAARERSRAALVGPATPAASDATDAAATIGGSMDAEKVEEKTKSLVTEYMQVADLKEAVLCVKEIVAGAKDADALGAMTKHMVAHVVDVSTEKARDLVAKLLAACVKQCGVDASVVKADMEAQIEQLEDIAIDVPMAPKLLGVMLAQLVVEGALEPSALGEATLKIDEGAVPTRRDFAAAALKEFKRNGKLGLKETVARSGLDVAAALTGDEKFDGPLAAFLEKNGLKELC